MNCYQSASVKTIHIYIYIYIYTHTHISNDTMGESNNDNHIYTHLKMLWGVKQTHETKFPAYFLLHFRHCNFFMFCALFSFTVSPVDTYTYLILYTNHSLPILKFTSYSVYPFSYWIGTWRHHFVVVVVIAPMRRPPRRPRTIVP